MKNLTRYWKTVVALLGVVVAVGNRVVEVVNDGYGDGKWDSADTVAVIIGVATVLGVYAKANTPPAGEPSDPNVSEVDPQR